MLQNLTRGFSGALQKLRGQGRLTEQNIAEALSDIRMILLDADVALSVTDDFLAAVKTQATGVHIDRNINPGKAFSHIVQRQLAEVMGGENSTLIFGKSPSVILACGLQGAGKTTNMAKIGKHLQSRKKRVMLGSVDVRRPAALEQLAVLAQSANIPCPPCAQTEHALDRAAELIKTARKQLADVLLVDTAGRTVLDEEMMDEIRALSDFLKPSETLFFVDALSGQDAVNTASYFHQAVGITGIIITKLDGDSRGGAALSARAITGAPIKFIGNGEKIDDLQEFQPARFAGRIMGMGDIAGLAEQTNKPTAGVAKTFQRALKKPNSFNLTDYLEQIRQAEKMGGAAGLADKLPAALADKLRGAESNATDLPKMAAVICAMTNAERTHPEIIKASRKRRIAKGAGVDVVRVNMLLRQHEQTRKMMKQLGKNPNALARMLGGLGG